MPIRPDEIKLREHNEIQHILGNPPTWMMRYGMTVMAFFLFLLVGLSAIIKYPDVVRCRVILTTANPPIRVIAQANGRVSKLLAAEKQTVLAGELLAVLESTANHEDVLHLENWLSVEHQPNEKLPESLQLGSLQPVFSEFSQHWLDLQYFQKMKGGGSQQKIAALQAQIAQLGRMNENLRRQRVIFKNEYELAEKDRARAKKLQESHLISDADFEKSEAIRFQQQRQMEQADASMIQNGITIQQHKSQIADLQLARSDNETTKILTITEDLHRLQTAIDDWEKQFLIIAPVGGQVSLTKAWSSELPIAAGDEILVIVQNKAGGNAPKPADFILAKGEIPAPDIEKLQKGMHSSISLDGFVPMKTGSLDAEVMDIALIPKKEAYQIALVLPAPMVTDAGKTIGFRPEMPGEARIFCSEKSVLWRLLEQAHSMLFQK